MPTSKKDLLKILESSRRIDIAVVGRKSGRAISMPVWHVVEKNVLYLLPVNGTDTQWFKNLQRNPAIRVAVPSGSKKRGTPSTRSWTEFRAQPTTAPRTVAAVIRKFGDKYKSSVVKKLYSKFNAAVRVPLF